MQKINVREGVQLTQEILAEVAKEIHKNAGKLQVAESSKGNKFASVQIPNVTIGNITGTLSLSWFNLKNTQKLAERDAAKVATASEKATKDLAELPEDVRNAVIASFK